MQKYLFIGGLRENIRTEVLKIAPATLTDALKEASKTELILKKQPSKIFSLDDNAEADQGETDLEEDEIMAINQRRFRLGKKPLNRRRPGNYGNNSNEIKCYNCNKMGHISKNCTAPRRKPIRAIQEENNEDNNQTQPDNNINAIRQHDDLDFW
jgi:hypothetical protein